jgi:tyrosyl-DNA phosphodiesterase-1
VSLPLPGADEAGQVVLPLPAIADLRRTWDFSKVAARLVPSLAGKHEGWPAVIRTGHTALMKAVRDLGCAPQKGQALSIECQVSPVLGSTPAQN